MGLLPSLRVVSLAWRRRRIPQLLEDLQQWEQDGRDLLAQLVELTDPEDDTHAACERVLRALED